MSLILNIIIILICILFALIFAILAIPFDYKFEGYVNETIYGKLILKWLFGLAKFTVYKEKEESDIKINCSLCRFTLPLSKMKKKNYKNIVKKKSFKVKRKITKKFINICLEYLKDMINIIRPRYINVSGTYGFEDPSLTGIICGVISVINSIIPNAFINVEPEFEDELYDIEIKVNGRIIGYIIFFKTLKLVLRKEARKNIFTRKEKDVKPLKI